jgi:hypothetical protein
MLIDQLTWPRCSTRFAGSQSQSQSRCKNSQIRHLSVRKCALMSTAGNPSLARFFVERTTRDFGSSVDVASDAFASGTAG